MAKALIAGIFFFATTANAEYDGPVCSPYAEVELRGTTVTPMGMITDPGTERISCPEGFIGDATLLCMNGQLTVAADACQMVPEAICLAFNGACGENSGSPTPTPSGGAVCEDDGCSDKDKTKLEANCGKSSFGKRCMLSCGNCGAQTSGLDRRLNNELEI